MLLIRHDHRLACTSGHEDLHRAVRVADGALVEAALDTIVGMLFASF
jgi:hypothetical protein